jgi:hypothetical protein
MRLPRPRDPGHDALRWYVRLFGITDEFGHRIRLGYTEYRDTELAAKQRAEQLLNLHRSLLDQPEICLVATVGRPWLESYTGYLVDATASPDWDAIPGRG